MYGGDQKSRKERVANGRSPQVAVPQRTRGRVEGWGGLGQVSL